MLAAKGGGVTRRRSSRTPSESLVIDGSVFFVGAHLGTVLFLLAPAQGFDLARGLVVVGWLVGWLVGWSVGWAAASQNPRLPGVRAVY